MKRLFLLASLGFGLAVRATAALHGITYSSGFADSGNIPDGNPNPWSDTRTVSGITDTVIESVSVRINVAGGYNGDLHVYLSYNNTLVPLMNRVGVGTGNSFGYSDAGFSIKFTDTAANNIHFYQAVGGYSVTGEATWRPDGRTLNPVSAAASEFDAAGAATLGAWNGMNPNGDWSLVIADVSGGGGQAQVQSWGLDISTSELISSVPEPANVALGLFAAGAVCLQAVRSWRSRRAPPAAP